MEKTTKPTPQNMTEARPLNRTILKKHTIHTAHTALTQPQKTHHTNTKVMAKKLKRKNKIPQKKGEYCMHYLTTRENTINKYNV